MKTLKTLLSLLTIFTICCACDHDNEDHHEFQFMAFPDDKPLEGRVLSQFDYRKPIRIHPFFDLSWATEEVASKIRDHMVPAVISYFQATLKVDSLQSNLVVTQEQLKDCEVTQSPEILLTEGVAADFVVFVNGELTNHAAMANSRAYILHERTNRPLVGRFSYNKFKNWEGFDDYTYELHLITTLHEFVHLLGFSKSLYDYYINPLTGGSLQYVATKAKVNDYQTLVLGLEPLNTRIQAYFNCSNLKGAYLENEGTSSNTASHFERRIFYNELMTAAAIDDRRISEFTLAVLEGSGWYTPNYSMSEPIFWGKGAGCPFLNEKCVDENKKARFGEYFCDNRGHVGCTFTGQAKGVCGIPSSNLNRKVIPAFDYFGDKIPVADAFADNCPYYKTFNHISCDNPDNQELSFIPGETFGRDSMCFSGTLAKDGELDFTMLYCIKKTCEEKSPGQFALGIEVEGSKYYCNDRESINIKGYEGKLDCPDSINHYCSTKAFKYCKRGCMGRGVCQNGECRCNPGFEGPGCSKLVRPDMPEGTTTSKTDSHIQTEDTDTEAEENFKGPITSLISSAESENNRSFLHLLAIVTGIVIILGIIVLVRKVECGQDNFDQTVEEAVSIKPEYAVVKTEESQTNVIEIESQEEPNEQKESQPNQEDIGLENSKDIKNGKTIEGAPSTAFGRQKIKYVEL